MQNFSRVSKHGQSIDVSFAKYSPVFACLHFTILRTSLLVTLSSQLIFSILLHIHISKASYLLLSVWVNVQVSAAYISTLQAKHFIILFFSSKFILLVSNIFFFINTLPSQLCSEYLLCNIHPLNLRYLISELAHMFHLLSNKINFHFIISLSAYVHHMTFVFLTLIFISKNDTEENHILWCIHLRIIAECNNMYGITV